MSPKQNRTFPPPWKVIKRHGGFGVEDAAGVIVAWVNYSRTSWREDSHWMTEDEARTMATVIAGMPQLVEGKSGRPEIFKPGVERANELPSLQLIADKTMKIGD